MDLNEMTRKDFENLPIINRNKTCDGFIILPTRRKHESGYFLFDIVPTLHCEPLGKFGVYDTNTLIINKKDIIMFEHLKKANLTHIWFRTTLFLAIPRYHSFEQLEKS